MPEPRSLLCMPSLLRAPDLVVSLFLMSSSLASGTLRPLGLREFKDDSSSNYALAHLTAFHHADAG